MRILDAANALPEPELRAIDPNRVESYVRAEGWRFNGKLSSARSVIYDRPEDRQFQIRIPMELGLGDYTILMGQAVVIIAKWLERKPEDILRYLLLPSSSDVVRLREIGPNTIRGDISIDDARDRLNGLRKVILTAAHEEEQPQSYFPRLSQKRPEEFLRKCRLGQTERGSYVFTVICPLNALPEEPNLFPVMPFTRRVTAHLAHALDHLSQAENQRDWDDLILTRTSRLGPLQLNISSNLCEGLIDLIPEEEAVVEFSIAWAPTRIDSESIPLPTRPVRLTSQWLPRLQYIAKRLRPRADVSERFWFIGTVEELEGDRFNDSDEREGDVVVRVLDAEGESRRARIDLSAVQHQIAIHAYKTGQQIRVRGILERVRRGFRISQAQDFRLLEQDMPT